LRQRLHGHLGQVPVPCPGALRTIGSAEPGLAALVVRGRSLGGGSVREQEEKA
jgi:hypothetical protein